jgi:hypothetical protein
MLGIKIMFGIFYDIMLGKADGAEFGSAAENEGA